MKDRNRIDIMGKGKVFIHLQYHYQPDKALYAVKYSQL